MAQQHFTLVSPAFEHDTFLPSRHTCDGRNVSPELRWSHAPANTRSFAIVLEDIDAAAGRPSTHWVLFDLPGNSDRLQADVGETGVPGRNDFQHHKYAGPCPAPNRGQHRYVFSLYALDVDSLGLSPGVERSKVDAAIGEHLLDQTQLRARFERRTF